MLIDGEIRESEDLEIWAMVKVAGAAAILAIIVAICMAIVMS